MFVLIFVCLSLFFFFFSSRRRHTRCLSDWSSDVCSSDLDRPQPLDLRPSTSARSPFRSTWRDSWRRGSRRTPTRSEERRVGKECRTRGSPQHEKKTKKKNRRTEKA